MRKTARISHFRAENRERRSKKINESSRLRANSLFGRDETVIAVELAHDFHDVVDRPKVGPRHGAIGHEERLAETAHLHREELGGRRGHAASKNLPNERAHVLPVTPQVAAISGTEIPRFKKSTISFSRSALSRRAARRASIDRLRGAAGGTASTDSDT